jgi:hypothetical protein
LNPRQTQIAFLRACFSLTNTSSFYSELCIRVKKSSFNYNEGGADDLSLVAVLFYWIFGCIFLLISTYGGYTFARLYSEVSFERSFS